MTSFPRQSQPDGSAGCSAAPPLSPDRTATSPPSQWLRIGFRGRPRRTSSTAQQGNNQHAHSLPVEHIDHDLSAQFPTARSVRRSRCVILLWSPHSEIWGTHGARASVDRHRGKYGHLAGRMCKRREFGGASPPRPGGSPPDASAGAHQHRVGGRVHPGSSPRGDLERGPLRSAVGCQLRCPHPTICPRAPRHGWGPESRRRHPGYRKPRRCLPLVAAHG